MASPVERRSVPVARPYFGREEEELTASVLRSGWVAQGPRVAEFEERFASYVGTEHAVAVSSCTAALHLALTVSGIGPGDEVLCPSLSFIATANTIVSAGGTPVFVDIDPETYNLDPSAIEASITPKTRAVMVVHQIGLPADLQRILDITARRNLLVIEDAACAIGSEYQGRRIGAPHGIVACFSHHARKILTTGEGGMLTTNDGDLAARLRRLRQHGMTVSDLARHNSRQVVIEEYEELGYNYRMTDLQAAVGIVQLARLEEMLRRRRYLAARYTEALQPLGWLKPPTAPSDCLHNFQSYMVRLLPSAPVTRDSLMQELLEMGVATRRGVMAIHRESPYRNPRWEKTLTQTNAASDETIILPLFHQLSEEEQDYVIESIRDIGGRAATARERSSGAKRRMA
jgi:perosamine synthetase